MVAPTSNMSPDEPRHGFPHALPAPERIPAPGKDSTLGTDFRS